MKTCRICKTEKAPSEFGVNSRFKDGLETGCKPCLREARLAAYWAKPEEYRRAKNARRKGDRAQSPEERRRRHLKSAYGITPEEEVALREKQEGRCPICAEPARVVDHCHTTGRVRGLLCQKCNRGLGHFMDSPVMLVKALEYLTGSATEYLTLNGVIDA
jgi:hypothetical protein